MAFIDYWSIAITVNKPFDSLVIQQMRDEMWVSPNVRLAGLSGMAHIKSEDLAVCYLYACKPVFDKRYPQG